MTIRPETPSDYSQVHELLSVAFGQQNEATLVAALRKNLDVFIPALSLVATIDHQILGHVLFSRIKIVCEHQAELVSLALAPVAVRPEFQRQGIGGALIVRGLDIATTLSFTSVIVLGHEHYYPRFGFSPAEKWHIKAPFEVPANSFMGIELMEDALKNVNGTVKYPKEFLMV